MIRKLLCYFGFHKWNYESTQLCIHERKADYKSAYNYMAYGSSKFYEYKCDCCPKKQWVSKGSNMNGYFERKINLKKP